MSFRQVGKYQRSELKSGRTLSWAELADLYYTKSAYMLKLNFEKKETGKMNCFLISLPGKGQSRQAQQECVIGTTAQQFLQPPPGYKVKKDSV